MDFPHKRPVKLYNFDCVYEWHLLNENEWRSFLIPLTALKLFRFKDYKYVETHIYFFANNFNMNPKGMQKQYEIS